jgi:type IV pilus assembly protein PilP
MTHLTHKWLLVLVAILGFFIAVCEKSAATKPAEKSSVLYVIPRPPEAEKNGKPGIAPESGEESAVKQTMDVQDLTPAQNSETAGDMFDHAHPPYEAKSILDPFMPLIQEKPATPSQDREPDKPRRMLTPLEKMSLSQVKLVAVVMGENLKVAMVEDATGKGYEVRIGTYMGKNGGQVVDIQSDRILIREMVADFKGIVTERFEELKLHKADSGE